MDNAKFVKQLRSIAEELTPLTLSVTPGAAPWDGTKYTKADAKPADPVALVWRSVLTITAELVEAQESPLTSRQMEYLKRLLFGGMGSLNDISFGQHAIDQSLDKKRRQLFDIFRE
jgi:hypothetical protein